MRQMAADYIGFFRWLHQEYGDIVYFEVPNARHCVVFSADLVHEALVEKAEILQVHSPKMAFEVIQSPCLPRTPLGDEHRRLRRFILTAFTPERMHGFRQVSATEAVRLGDRLRPGEAVDIRREIERFTWKALTTCILGGGRELDPAVGLPTLRALKLSFIVLAMPAYSLLRKLPLPHDIKARKAIKALDALTYEAIRAARSANADGASLISHLVQAAELGAGDWSFGSDREIRDEAYAMLFGALDGPIHPLTHLPFQLRRNPAARERLEAEIDGVAGDRPLEAADLDRLPYTHAVFKELLRLHPAAPLLVPRMATEDCELGGYSVPKGTLVEVGVQAMHRRPDYWEDSETFHPDRWLDGQACPRNAYVPFSLEPRGGSRYRHLGCRHRGPRPEEAYRARNR